LYGGVYEKMKKLKILW